MREPFLWQKIVCLNNKHDFKTITSNHDDNVNHRQKNIYLARCLTGLFLHRDQRHQKQLAARWCRPRASQLPWLLNRKCCLLFVQNRNSARNTCVQNIKSIVAMNGVCESMLVAILTPAAFCIRVIGQQYPCDDNMSTITFVRSKLKSSRNLRLAVAW